MPACRRSTREEADYENLLNTLIPFSNRLAALLSTYHPDIATILDVGRQRVARAAGPAGHHRPGDQRRLPLLPEDRRGCVGAEQAARRQHLRLLQHLHPLQRRQQPGLQPDRAADGRDVVPRSRFSRRWPEPAPPSTARPSWRRSTRCRAPRPPAPASRRRRRRPRPRPAPTARARPPPTRSTASSGSPTSPRRPPSAASSTSSSGARREAAAPLPDVGVQVRRLRARLPRPAGRAWP